MSISHNSANMNSNNNNNKTSNGQHESTASSASTQFFSVGDKVRVDVSLDMFKQMQEGHGGWNFKMADVNITQLFTFVKLIQVLLQKARFIFRSVI